MKDIQAKKKELSLEEMRKLEKEPFTLENWRDKLWLNTYHYSYIDETLEKVVEGLLEAQEKEHKKEIEKLTNLIEC